MLRVWFLTGPGQCMSPGGRFQRFPFLGPRDTARVIQAKYKEFQDWLWSLPWAQWGMLSAGWVQEQLPPALISFTLSFHDWGYPPPGISMDYQWFLHTEWEREELHLHIPPGTTLSPFPQCIGGWEIYPDKPRIFLISFSFRVTGNTSHRVFYF